jgi:hypothetical protein
LIASLSRRRALSWMLLPAAGLVVPAAWASAARIASARVWPAQEYTRLILEGPLPIAHQLLLLKDPHRIVLDLEASSSPPSSRNCPPSAAGRLSPASLREEGARRAASSSTSAAR